MSYLNIYNDYKEINYKLQIYFTKKILNKYFQKRVLRKKSV